MSFLPPNPSIHPRSFRFSHVFSLITAYAHIHKHIPKYNMLGLYNVPCIFRADHLVVGS